MFRDFLANSGAEVLEIGCGTGLFTSELACTAKRITAIDISPDLLNRAKERVTANNVVFALENAFAMSFPSAHFDAVIGSSCLHHLDAARALQEFHRVLKPGGRIMFTEPNMLNPQIALQKNIPYLKRRSGDSPDETAFIRFNLKRSLIRAGFADISIVPFDFVHPAIPQWLLSIAVPFLSTCETIPFIKEIAGSLAIVGVKS